MRARALSLSLSLSFSLLSVRSREYAGKHAFHQYNGRSNQSPRNYLIPNEISPDYAIRGKHVLVPGRADASAIHAQLPIYCFDHYFLLRTSRRVKLKRATRIRKHETKDIRNAEIRPNSEQRKQAEESNDSTFKNV